MGHVFYGNRQCLEFCSPLYINLKFSRKVLILIFFLMITFLLHGLFNFLKCIFLRKRVCFYKDSSCL